MVIEASAAKGLGAFRFLSRCSGPDGLPLRLSAQGRLELPEGPERRDSVLPDARQGARGAGQLRRSKSGRAPATLRPELLREGE